MIVVRVKKKGIFVVQWGLYEKSGFSYSFSSINVLDDKPNYVLILCVYYCIKCAEIFRH